MHVTGNVFISYSPPINNNATLPRGYSGISIGKHWILTHGSILVPVLHRSPSLYDCITALIPGQLTLLSTVNQPVDQLNFTIYHNRAATIRSGKLVAAWKCSILKETLERSFDGWVFDRQDTRHRLFLPVLVLIKCEPAMQLRRDFSQWVENEKEKSDDRTKIEEILLRLAEQSISGRPTKGSAVQVVSTPFGNTLFADSVTRGIVGNLVGIEKCLILVDVSAFPGSEGAPVYLIDNREWVDYTFAVYLLPSLKEILRSRLPHTEPRCLLLSSTLPRHFTYQIDYLLERSIVIVKCGRHWGTGILVDSRTGTFLTCAHIVANSKPLQQEIELGKPLKGGKCQWFATAQLIYKTAEGQPFDMAVLRTDPKCYRDLSMRAIKIADKAPRKGERVLSIGFPFSSNCEATISDGVISNASDCMLQTSCCAQSGTSGGPIVRQTTLEMLGMMVCNIASASDCTTTLYPRLSMAIPVSVFKKTLRRYLRTSDPRTLEKLTESDANTRATWNLRPFLLSRI